MACVVLLSVSLASCGDDDDDDKSRRPKQGGASGMTSCSDVWVTGKTLPAKYDGCTEDGGISAPTVLDCADGSSWTSYNDKFYAKLGGEIYAVKGEMADDPAYMAFYNECS